MTEGNLPQILNFYAYFIRIFMVLHFIQNKLTIMNIGNIDLPPKKTDPVVKLVLRYIIRLRKGEIHATKEIQT